VDFRAQNKLTNVQPVVKSPMKNKQNFLGKVKGNYIEFKKLKQFYILGTKKIKNQNMRISSNNHHRTIKLDLEKVITLTNSNSSLTKRINKLNSQNKFSMKKR